MLVELPRAMPHQRPRRTNRGNSAGVIGREQDGARKRARPSQCVPTTPPAASTPSSRWTPVARSLVDRHRARLVFRRKPDYARFDAVVEIDRPDELPTRLHTRPPVRAGARSPQRAADSARAAAAFSRSSPRQREQRRSRRARAADHRGHRRFADSRAARSRPIASGLIGSRALRADLQQCQQRGHDDNADQRKEPAFVSIRKDRRPRDGELKKMLLRQARLIRDRQA